MDDDDTGPFCSIYGWVAWIILMEHSLLALATLIYVLMAGAVDIMAAMIKKDYVGVNATEERILSFSDKVDYQIVPLVFSLYVLAFLYFLFMARVLSYAVRKSNWTLLRIWTGVQGILFVISVPLTIIWINSAPYFDPDHTVWCCYQIYRLLSIIVVGLYGEAIRIAILYPLPDSDPYSLNYYQYNY